MNKQYVLTTIAAASVMWVGIGSVEAGQGKQSGQQKVEEQMGSGGNAMGVPVPGSVSDMEKTEKEPDVSKIKSSETILQLPYSVEGEILKIDGETYRISGKSGEEVSLIVNKDTNLDCAAASQGNDSRTSSEVISSDRMQAKDQAPEASEQQVAQGQRQDETARGSGFRIGSCNFQTGDHVKAEIDDNGRATTLKYLAAGSSSGMGNSESDMGAGRQIR
ncbi:MAG TPA: hypothetical protein VFI05_10680 [Nitrospiraceae bacterium]|nr:hypothetical protein [Nitrospiraceae bacterium]